MGLRSLFKVRQPGNGQSAQDTFERASKESKSRKFPSQDNSQNSGGKKPVK
jgi:hypothetical protein